MSDIGDGASRRGRLLVLVLGVWARTVGPPNFFEWVANPLQTPFEEAENSSVDLILKNILHEDVVSSLSDPVHNLGALSIMEKSELQQATARPPGVSLVKWEIPELLADSEEISSLRVDVDNALSTAEKLQAASLGCGGVYFVGGKAGESIAVFKPEDEEAYGPRNLRGYGGDYHLPLGSPHPMRKGFITGEGAQRELAAFVIDYVNGSNAGVPPTALVTIDKEGGMPQRGSIQRFIKHWCSVEDVSSSFFLTEQVHHIGVLDIRLFNTDRHGGNLLVDSKEEKNIIPIDHGYCLPDIYNLGEAWFEWMSWKKAKEPFSAEMKKWIAELDSDKDAMILRQLAVREECVLTFQATTMLLQKAAAAGLSLFDIGGLIQRDLPGSGAPSPFEEAISKCGDIDSLDSHQFISKLEPALEQLIKAKNCKVLTIAHF